MEDPQQKSGRLALDPEGEPSARRLWSCVWSPSRLGRRRPASGNAWYFDNEMTPTQISLCPGTCTAVEAVMGARIDILLHCPRMESPVK
jgi:hypothetical protein